MILFSEKVVPTFTSSNLNILTVEDFQEVFFDVFEFEINGKKFIAEKVSDYKKLPVVTIPLVLEGKELTAPFVLQRGKFEILFNKNNSTYIKDVSNEEIEPVVERKNHEVEIEEILFEKKEDLLREVLQARRSAEKYVETLKQQKIDEAVQYFDTKKEAFDKQINECKSSLLDEFLSLVENVKSEFFEFNDIEKKKLTSFVENYISNISDELTHAIDKKQELAEQKFNQQINELATNILSGVLLKEISSNNKKANKDINERFLSINNNVKELVNKNIEKIENKVDTKLTEFNNTIINLEKINIELNDQINKGDNKALSRIGNIKSQLEEAINTTKSTINDRLEITEEKIKALHDTNTQLEVSIIESESSLVSHIDEVINNAKSTINDRLNSAEEKVKTLQDTNTQLEASIVESESSLIARINEAESKIRTFYDDKIDLISERVEDITTENKQYVLGLINESKQSLLDEIANIKVDVPNIVIEKTNGKQEVDLKGIKSELEKIIGTRFSNEIQSLKRLIEMSSGGGSVAKQFAAGGTMEGTLNVTGKYLSGGVDLIDIFSGGGGSDDIYVNALVRANSANWDEAYNTSVVYQSNSATYATIDFTNSNFFPLSGGVITGETRINNNLTVFGNLTATGTTTFANTVFSVTSALSVVHVGSGPAVWIGNNGTGDIASFYDIDQDIEILHVGGINSDNPNVGVKTSTPNKTFTVVGEISSTSDITTSGNIYTENNGNSVQWNTAYNLVSGNNLVYTSENQTISGVKAFNDLPLIPVAPVSGANPTSKDYVDTLVSSVSSSIQDSTLNIISNSSNAFALSSMYNNKVIRCTSSASVVVTLPTALPQGFNCMLIQSSSGQISLTGATGVEVQSFGNLIKTAGQHAPVSVICLEPNIYNISGNLI